MKDRKDPADRPDERKVFRSPAAVAVWWLWLLFALGNLIDLAVQGRDHLALVAAFILLFVTGIVYVSALRPRLVADTDELVIANPFRDHRVGWAAVAGADPTDLLRVRCEWPAGEGTDRRAIYAWAVHSSRRRQVAAEMRARRQSRRGGGSGSGGFGSGGFAGGGLGGFGWTGSLGASAGPAPEHDPLTLDANQVVAAITAHAVQAQQDAAEAAPTAPLSTWYWPSVAAVVAPGLALLIVALA